ncbi:hypothetical protein, partial [Pseudolactococcus carnosus]|uniref:hypothetical protein n=2 Tax=Pseudolactococcus carnosus TaxID=2749961 RepID=UPI001FBAD29D
KKKKVIMKGLHMKSNINEIQEISKKISGREDIITLYQEYGHDILSNLKSNKLDSYGIWKNFIHCEQHSILECLLLFAHSSYQKSIDYCWRMKSILT